MTDLDCAKRLINIVRNREHEAIKRRVIAVADYEGAKAASKVWNEEHKDDMDWRNSDPYHLDEKAVQRAREEESDEISLANFTINRVLDTLVKEKV